MQNKKEETFIITEIGNGAYRARKMAEEAETESVPQPAPQSPPNQSQPEPKGNWFIKFESVKRFSKIGTFEIGKEDDLFCYDNGRGTPINLFNSSVFRLLKLSFFENWEP